MQACLVQVTTSSVLGSRRGLRAQQPRRQHVRQHPGTARCEVAKPGGGARDDELSQQAAAAAAPDSEFAALQGCRLDRWIGPGLACKEMASLPPTLPPPCLTCAFASTAFPSPASPRVPAHSARRQARARQGGARGAAGRWQRPHQDQRAAPHAAQRRGAECDAPLRPALARSGGSQPGGAGAPFGMATYVAVEFLARRNGEALHMHALSPHVMLHCCPPRCFCCPRCCPPASLLPT